MIWQCGTFPVSFVFGCTADVLCVCAGPEPMVQAVSMMAWGMNDKRKGAYLHVHRATYEL